MSEERDVREEPAQTQAVEQTIRRAGQTPRNAHGGRPTTCTPEIAQAMQEALEQYGFLGLACDLVGVGRTTAYEWIERGEAGEQPFDVFADAVKKGRAAFQAQAAQTIRDGRQGWQSRAWMLERSDPEQYAVRNRVEHSGRVETTTAPVLTPSEWQDRRSRILGERETGPN